MPDVNSGRVQRNPTGSDHRAIAEKMCFTVSKKGHHPMLTESQNPQTTNIDQLSTLEMVQRINDEDAKVALAVREVLPQIAQAIDAIAERMLRGGRLIYAGAGTSGR